MTSWDGRSSIQYIVSGEYTYYHCKGCSGHTINVNYMSIDANSSDQALERAMKQIREQRIGMTVTFALNVRERQS